MDERTPIHRRQLLYRLAQAGLGASLPLGSLLGLVGCRAQRPARPAPLGYGPLAPVRDEVSGEFLLRLPAGFRYRSLGWTGTALRDGSITPSAHDGMGIVAAQGARLTLVRNHELTTTSGAFGPDWLRYDPAASAGAIAFEFDTKTGVAGDFRAVLTGTMQNCSGGITPWGTWLSCEELVFDPELGLDDLGRPQERLKRPHGFVFEVDPSGLVAPQRLSGMGAFKHEAAAVHAVTGIVYLTEDYHQTAGFYRYLPTTPGQLARGGRLQMLAVKGQPHLLSGLHSGQSFDTHWVDIDEPTRLRDQQGRVGLGVFAQGQAAGGTSFTRLEGCFAEADTIFFTSTDGGDLQHGQVFAYFPKEERLLLLYETRALAALDYPDNLCASPRGGLLLCEDNDSNRPQRLVGLRADGRTFDFAENNVVLKSMAGVDRDYRGEEWCGACYSPDGRWLFANIYQPGFTVAITGPWGGVGL